jgi:hypothetical protein
MEKITDREPITDRKAARAAEAARAARVAAREAAWAAREAAWADRAAAHVARAARAAPSAAARAARAAREAASEEKSMKHLHMIEARYLGATDHRGAHVKLTSLRFGVSKTYPYSSGWTDSLQGAQDILKRLGYTILGQGETATDYIIAVAEFCALPFEEPDGPGHDHTIRFRGATLNNRCGRKVRA